MEVTKAPKWLTATNYSLGGDRLPSKLDDLDGEGTALDTVRNRPDQKFKTYKKIAKRLAEMEEFIEFLNEKKNKGIPRE